MSDPTLQVVEPTSPTMVLAAIVKLVREHQLTCYTPYTIRVSAPYFRRHAPELLHDLPWGIWAQETEILYPYNWAPAHTPAAQALPDRPSVIVVGKDALNLGGQSLSYVDDLAYGDQGGQTVCWVDRREFPWFGRLVTQVETHALIIAIAEVIALAPTIGPSLQSAQA